MVNHHKLPARHACALVGLSRDSYRHESQTSAPNAELREQIVQTAHARRRWGYRMIHDVLRPQYPNINHKRVYRTACNVRRIESPVNWRFNATQQD